MLNNPAMSLNKELGSNKLTVTPEQLIVILKQKLKQGIDPLEEYRKYSVDWGNRYGLDKSQSDAGLGYEINDLHLLYIALKDIDKWGMNYNIIWDGLIEYGYTPHDHMEEFTNDLQNSELGTGSLPSLVSKYLQYKTKYPFIRSLRSTGGSIIGADTTATATTQGRITLPYTSGKISSFGGVNDTLAGERFQNLSFTTIDPDETKKYGEGANAVTMYLARKWPLWYRNMFVGDTTRGIISAKASGKYGLFAYLNTMALYCAGRFQGTKYRKDLDNMNPWITFTNPKTGYTVTCLRIDWGPAKSTGRNWDLSPWAMKFMNADTNDNVTARFATPEEIKAAKQYMENLNKVGQENTFLYKLYRQRMESPASATSSQATPSSSTVEANTGGSDKVIPLLLTTFGIVGFSVWQATRKRGR